MDGPFVLGTGPMWGALYSALVASLLCLLFLGGLSAKVGGADVTTGALRVALWSALAMGVTAAVGSLLGAAV